MDTVLEPYPCVMYLHDANGRHTWITSTDLAVLGSPNKTEALLFMNQSEVDSYVEKIKRFDISTYKNLIIEPSGLFNVIADMQGI